MVKKVESNMKPIEENLEIPDSEASETKTLREQSDDEEDFLGRSNENIDLTQVEVTSKGSPTKVSKPLLSEKEL